MNTVVKDWQIVSVFDAEELVGQVLYATVVDDSTCRFAVDDYVTTSKIEKINTFTNLVTTHSGSVYQLLGTGKTSRVEIAHFELLRLGHSPQEIKALTKVSH